MKNINQERFQELMKDPGVIVLDVRTEAEAKQGIIPDAMIIDFHDSENFKNKIEELDREATYLVYCRIGSRSANTCFMMESMGFKDVYNLTGGITAWTGEVVLPKEEHPDVVQYDLICVGGGIMSTTLALMSKIIHPELKIGIFERLEKVAQESSAAWNNAGTGHSAFCELNYTKVADDGHVDLSKAVKVCTQFELSRQFWAYLVEHGWIKDPSMFINPVPHHAWVRGEKNVALLKRRYEAMKDHFMFKGMQFTEDAEVMKKWFPLIMEDRPSEVLGASRMEEGVEMNFEELTKELSRILNEEFDQSIHFNHEVLDIDPDVDLDWTVKVKDLTSGKVKHFDADHVFIGAGGGALPLLQKVEIDEKDGYGGFPISGQWLICKNRALIEKHYAKVYSKADVGTPPMSVPHLDTRIIEGKRELLFGPFAGFSTKFLKEGSYMDLPMSINFDNIPSMWGAFWHNLDLTSYLIKQVTMSHEDRMEELRKFVVDAKSDEWELLTAGQRVQIIKRDEEDGGSLEFGTEVVSSKDGTITALLGASPGASTAVSVMLEVLMKAFPELLEDKKGASIMNEMIPMWNKDPEQSKELLIAERKRTHGVLQLEKTELA